MPFKFQLTGANMAGSRINMNLKLKTLVFRKAKCVIDR